METFNLTIKFGKILLAKNGERNRKVNLSKVDNYMKKKFKVIFLTAILFIFSKSIFLSLSTLISIQFPDSFS